MSLVDQLRTKCARKGLGVSGNAQTLLERLMRHEKKSKQGPKKKAPAKAKSSYVPKPKKMVAFKKNRLSAAFYFHEVCGGKITKCSPQLITQADGRQKLKEIKLVTGTNGIRHPQWVLVKTA